MEQIELNKYQRLALRLLELGMMSRERADAACVEVADWHVGDPDQDVDATVLVEFDVAVQAHGDDVDYAEEAYIHLLRKAASLSGGSVTVTDIELVPDEDEDGDGEGGEDGAGEEFKQLRFKVNGEPKCWDIDSVSDDYLDLTAVSTGIDDLGPGGDDPRAFYLIIESMDNIFLLATHEQARTLRDEFGLKIDVRTP